MLMKQQEIWLTFKARPAMTNICLLDTKCLFYIIEKLFLCNRRSKFNIAVY